MSYGLEVRDKDNLLSFSIRSRLIRLIATYSVFMPAGTTSRTVTVPGITNDGTWFALLGFPLFGVTISDNLVTITYTSSSSSATWVLLVGRY